MAKKKSIKRRKRRNPASKATRLVLLEGIQKILDSNCGLNRKNEIRDLMDYLDDPKNVTPAFKRFRRNATWASYDPDNPRDQAARAKHAQTLRDEYAQKRAKQKAPWATPLTEAEERKLKHDEYWDIRRGPYYGRRELGDGWSVAPRDVPTDDPIHDVNKEEEDNLRMLEIVGDAIQEAKRGNFSVFNLTRSSNEYSSDEQRRAFVANGGVFKLMRGYEHLGELPFYSSFSRNMLLKYLKDFPNGHYAKQIRAGFDAVARMEAAEQEYETRKIQERHTLERESSLTGSPFRRYY